MHDEHNTFKAGPANKIPIPMLLEIERALRRKESPIPGFADQHNWIGAPPQDVFEE